MPRALPRGTLLADRYLALDVVGMGGMGVVHAAFDRQLDRKVALKLLRAEEGNTERLVREAQCLARLAHPNVVVVHDVGVALGRAYITMEYVEGWTMRRWLEETRPPAERVLDAYLEAAQGLAAAHAAGLVHRDFKPENVLVGEDGRVRVTDFGLSRPFEADVPSHVAAMSEGGEAPHPRRSQLEGTPRYIAPERFQGQPADARSDQFAFCVALYEALYGEYPFQVQALRDLPAAMAKGHVRPSPRRARVPAAVRAALLRGLAAAPDARFSSMNALSAALRAGRGRRRRQLLRLWLTALGVLLALGGTAAAALHPQEHARLCQGAEDRLAGIWDEPQKAALERAFLRTELPYAPSTWKTLREALDRYAARWVEAHTEACVATRVHGEQSEQVLDLRAACLEQQRSRLSALVQVLGEVDRKGAAKAVDAAHGLGDPALCSVTEVIDARLSPPQDRATQEKSAALRARLGAIEARYNLGKETGPLLSEARRLSSEAGTLGYRPLQAEAGKLLGALSGGQVAPAEVRATLEQALLAAEAGHHERAALEIWLALGENAVSYEARYEDAARDLDHAEAYLDRLGEGAEAMFLLETRAALHRAQGRREEAARAAAQAVALGERLFGKASPRLLQPLAELGIDLHVAGQDQASLDVLRRAIDLGVGALGAEHPVVIKLRADLGSVLIDSARYAEAVAVLRPALAALGHTDDALVQSGVMSNLGEALMHLDQFAEALPLTQRSLAIDARMLGPRHSHLALDFVILGNELVGLGRRDEALDHYKRALDVAEASETPETTLEVLGIAHQTLERCGAPCAWLRRKVESRAQELRQ